MDAAVIGLGLIGGSVLKALAAAGHRVTGYDADPDTRTAARQDGFAVADSVRAAVAASELVVLAVPLPVLPSVLAELTDHDGLVTDVTSVKGPVRDLATAHHLRRFVGGHPMAGKETSGYASADAQLFDGCAWVLCLEPQQTRLDDWLTLATVWTGLGARVVPVTAAEHDQAVAQVSHAPHLFAAALAGQLVDNPLAAALAAGSFRDGTRVAASRAELVAAMCGGNALAVGDALDGLIEDLNRMRTVLREPDPIGRLADVLRPAGAARRGWPARPGAAGTLAVEASALLALGRCGGWVTAVADDRATVQTIHPESQAGSG